VREKKQPCLELHVTPTEEIQVTQDCKSASTFGGSNCSNAKRHVQVCKNVREKEQPNWMTSDEFARLVNDSQGDYCLNPISYTEAMQSNEQKQTSPKENETWELVN
jgi:hypothetical protein